MQAVAGVLVLAGLGALHPVVSSSLAAVRPVVAVQPASSSAARTIPAAPAVVTGSARCAVAAPSTAAGYSAAFGSLPTAQWGAGDVAVSVPVGSRVVWLFGDTFSAGPAGHGRFVHSTAIVQDRGCLHVSGAGAQVLPDDATSALPSAANPSTVFWVESGRAVGVDAIEVTARAIRIVGPGAWDFLDGGFDRTATMTVTRAGDLIFAGWSAKTVGPAPDPGPMLPCDLSGQPQPHHFCYARHVHPELPLADGRVLVTTCQNWDDGVLHGFAAYRPIFSQA